MWKYVGHDAHMKNDIFSNQGCYFDLHFLELNIFLKIANIP